MQKSALKKTGVLLLTVFIAILHFPLLSANNKSLTKTKQPETNYPVSLTNVFAPAHTDENLANNTNALYDSMQLDLMGLSKQTFDYAIKGFAHLVQAGKLANEHIISIVDFSMPSSKKRLFVINLSQIKVIFNTYVAHGVNSGAAMASEFSNKPESYKSSLGFYETLHTYSGGHGYSLRLEGLEKGINDNANRRDIVMHAADYVNEDLIKSQGYIGRSWGCPALPQKLYKPIINTIKDGTCLFIYSPNKAYLSTSKIINA